MCASGPEICRYIHLKVRASYVFLFFFHQNLNVRNCVQLILPGARFYSTDRSCTSFKTIHRSTWQANAKKPKQTNKNTKMLRSNKGIHPYVPFTWVRGWPWVSPFSSHWSLWVLKCCFSGTEKCKLYNVFHYTFVAQIWQIYSKTAIVLNLFNANSI